MAPSQNNLSLLIGPTEEEDSPSLALTTPDALEIVQLIKDYQVALALQSSESVQSSPARHINSKAQSGDDVCMNKQVFEPAKRSKSENDAVFRQAMPQQANTKCDANMGVTKAEISAVFTDDI